MFFSSLAITDCRSASCCCLPRTPALAFCRLRSWMSSRRELLLKLGLLGCQCQGRGHACRPAAGPCRTELLADLAKPDSRPAVCVVRGGVYVRSLAARRQALTVLGELLLQLLDIRKDVLEFRSWRRAAAPRLVPGRRPARASGDGLG
ncbi:unnamed protein product [Prorocentrum cordatum]|uniref:Uncharacterized protein n=1 Tax=Prorocentrum cordatum TaxID=2364126 RepID=A0ABN9S5J1_9DINO|nr:unnamed protein product [Polarella glacialis]